MPALLLNTACLAQDLYTEDDEWAHMGAYQQSPSVAPSVPDTVNQLVWPHASTLRSMTAMALPRSATSALHVAVCNVQWQLLWPWCCYPPSDVLRENSNIRPRVSAVMTDL